MRTFNLRGALFEALAGVALITVAPAAIAAPNVATEKQLASLAARAELSSASTTAASPFTLHIEDASGNAVRLVRVEGSGWKLAIDATAPGSDAKSLVHEASYESSKVDRPPQAVTSVDEPLTVFIDGASGFTYVYNQDGGWRFVGKLVDRRD